MELGKFERRDAYTWEIAPQGNMRVPAIIYGDETLLRAMDEKVYEQVTNVATLPGIVQASYAMPDAHWGYGFPIGGVAAFDPDADGVVSAGGVGFDISCGVRCLLTGLHHGDISAVQKALADELSRTIPAGVGSTGKLHLNEREMNAMLTDGAAWAVDRGFGTPTDLERIEERGCMRGARPEYVSARAKKRQQDEMGTLGSGNHYLEIQHITEILDADVARVFGLAQDQVVVSIHCGSRGLGHQIGTEFLKKMLVTAQQCGITLPDRELACAPLNSPVGKEYLGAMRAAINCALANRQILTQLVRDVFRRFFPETNLPLLYDVSHNTCKLETHEVDGQSRQFFVHRKGATRAFGPNHCDVPSALRSAGQPVLIGGSMGTASYILVGTKEAEIKSFSSACHGAGRAMSRHAATRKWNGSAVMAELAERGILIRSPSKRGVAEEAPDAYKDVTAVVTAAEKAGIAQRVARLEPLVCIKG